MTGRTPVRHRLQSHLRRCGLQVLYRTEGWYYDDRDPDARAARNSETMGGTMCPIEDIGDNAYGWQRWEVTL